MRIELFQPTVEGEARLLLLIDGFTDESRGLEGRTKLAKLDFFLRYPAYFDRALAVRRVTTQGRAATRATLPTIESRMVRYRFGPWDPAYFALLGRLLGKGLIESRPTGRGFAYRSTPRGHSVSERIAATESWSEVRERVALLRRHFDLTGAGLKAFVYKHFPEVAQQALGAPL